MINNIMRYNKYMYMLTNPKKAVWSSQFLNDNDILNM